MNFIKQLAGLRTKSLWLIMVGLLFLAMFGKQAGRFWGVESAFGYGGGPPAGAYSPPIPPAEGFSIVINDGDAETDSRVATLTLNGGSDVVNMAISNFADFRGASQETYWTTKLWVLLEGAGEKTVYTKFYNQWGQASAVVSDIITLASPALPAEVLTPAQRADINGDGIVGLLDFNVLMIGWGRSGTGNAADLNSDGKADLLDFNLLMIYWTA
jgi:hypothetical protein